MSSPEPHRRSAGLAGRRSSSLLRISTNAEQRPKHHSILKNIFNFGRRRNYSRKPEASPLLQEEAQSPEEDLNHNCEQSGCQRIQLNIAGQVYETQLKTLWRFPDTLLGNEERRREFWNPERNEYFFDRHRPSFDAILNFYQNGGQLRCPEDVHEDVFLDEIQFFALGDDIIKSYRKNVGYLDDEDVEIPRTHCSRFFWRLFTNTSGSLASRLIGLWSCAIIVISVAIICVETLPKYRNAGCQGRIVNDAISHELATLFLIETLCVFWFCLETGVRFITTPGKKKFFHNPLNIIDIVTIFPYVGTVTEWYYQSVCSLDQLSRIAFIFVLLKLLHVMRVFKLCRYVQGLRILFFTLKSSSIELLLHLFLVSCMMMVFASGMYFAELSDPQPNFTSIPDAFWWAVVTLTTVGYGDYVPKTVGGKLIGSLCIIEGVMVVAIHLPVLVANFTKYYSHQTGKILRK